jgi:hypothetical protein
MNYASDACAMIAYLRGEPGSAVVKSPIEREGKKMIQPQVFEGTLEEITEQLRATALTGRFKVIVVPEEVITTDQNGAWTLKDAPAQSSVHQDARNRPSILGKYAGRIPSSAEFIQEKQKEIAHEDSKIGL